MTAYFISNDTTVQLSLGTSDTVFLAEGVNFAAVNSNGIVELELS